jgi:hypothetical protein
LQVILIGLFVIDILFFLFIQVSLVLIGTLDWIDLVLIVANALSLTLNDWQ